MIRTILFFTLTWTILILSLLLFIPYFILYISGADRAKRNYLRSVIRTWGKFTLLIAGIKTEINGKENFPAGNEIFVVVSNHQGNFDIPVLASVFPFIPAFIAKIELRKVPVISTWMRVIQCVLIDRKKSRIARLKICERIRKPDMNPLVLFPEGTRSRGNFMGTFKTGSLKLIFHHKLSVLPVSVSGSYRGYEERGRISPAKVRVTIHPAINTGRYKRDDFAGFENALKKTIGSAL